MDEESEIKFQQDPITYIPEYYPLIMEDSVFPEIQEFNPNQTVKRLRKKAAKLSAPQKKIASFKMTELSSTLKITSK